MYNVLHFVVEQCTMPPLSYIALPTSSRITNAMYHHIPVCGNSLYHCEGTVLLHLVFFCVWFACVSGFALASLFPSAEERACTTSYILW